MQKFRFYRLEYIFKSYHKRDNSLSELILDIKNLITFLEKHTKTCLIMEKWIQKTMLAENIKELMEIDKLN